MSAGTTSNVTMWGCSESQSSFTCNGSVAHVAAELGTCPVDGFDQPVGLGLGRGHAGPQSNSAQYSTAARDGSPRFLASPGVKYLSRQSSSVVQSSNDI